MKQCVGLANLGVKSYCSEESVNILSSIQLYFQASRKSARNKEIELNSCAIYVVSNRPVSELKVSQEPDLLDRYKSEQRCITTRKQ